MNSNTSWDEIIHFLETIAPYVIPSLFLLFMDWRQRRANVKQTESKTGSTLASAAEHFVGTGLTLVSQLEKQLETQGTELAEKTLALSRANSRVRLLEERQEELTLQNSILAERDNRRSATDDKSQVKIKNLTRCVEWLLHQLRQAGVTGLNLPKPWNVEKWVECADELNGESWNAEQANKDKPEPPPAPSGDKQGE
jgi:hypothetical protein